MPAFHKTLLGAALFAAAIPACRPVCACLFDPTLRARVTGLVATPSGAPVANAFMALQVLGSVCTSVAGGGSPGTVGVTGADGRFDLEVESVVPGSQCIRVRAGRNNGQMMTDSTVTFVDVLFSRAGDSVSVSLTLP